MSNSSTQDQQSSIRRFAYLALAAAAMTYLLIVIGGIVRVTGSGLGCPDWPTCFGQWIPPLRADAIIEYVHRLVATLTSPLILAAALVAFWRFRGLKLITRSFLWAVILLAVQGLLGGIVVLLETPPDLVAVHMGNALLIQALVLIPAVIAYNLRSTSGRGDSLSFQSDFARLALWTLAAVFIVLVSGAFVAGSGSTYACSGWPLCNGRLIPLHSLGWIHMLHRLLVALSSLLVVLLVLRARRYTEQDARVLKVAWATAILYFAQALIGALKVSFQFPILLLGLHVAIAAAVWAAIVILVALVGLAEQPPTPLSKALPSAQVQ